jgi:hypothetical protein
MKCDCDANQEVPQWLKKLWQTRWEVKWGGWMLLWWVSCFIYCYAECHYAEYRYAFYHYAKCHGAILLDNWLSLSWIIFQVVSSLDADFWILLGVRMFIEKHSHKMPILIRNMIWRTKTYSTPFTIGFRIQRTLIARHISFLPIIKLNILLVSSWDVDSWQ